MSVQVDGDAVRNHVHQGGPVRVLGQLHEHRENRRGSAGGRAGQNGGIGDDPSLTRHGRALREIGFSFVAAGVQEHFAARAVEERAFPAEGLDRHKVAHHEPTVGDDHRVEPVGTGVVSSIAGEEREVARCGGRVRHRVAVGDVRMTNLDQIIGKLAESVVRHRRRNGLKPISGGNAVVVEVVVGETLHEHAPAAARPRLRKECADLRRGGIAEAEVHRRRRVGRVAEPDFLLAVGRERCKLRGVGKAVGLHEEEAELHAVRLERDGERVGVGRRVCGDGRDFGEVVPGVLVALAVNRAGCDVELVRGAVGVAEGERD